MNNLHVSKPRKRPLKFRADVCRHAQQRAAADRPLYGKPVRGMSNSMCNMRALHRRLERAGPRRLTFPFARFRRIGSCRASYAIRCGRCRLHIIAHMGVLDLRWWSTLRIDEEPSRTLLDGAACPWPRTVGEGIGERWRTRASCLPSLGLR